VIEDRTEQLQTGRNRLRRQGQQRRSGEESR
jgi:hypothetical protein